MTRRSYKRRKSHRRRSRKRHVERFDLHDCSKKEMRIIEALNNPHHKKHAFEIVCIHHSKNPRAKNLFLMGGFTEGTVELEALDDKVWMAEILDTIDLYRTNVYIVRWDSRPLTYLVHHMLTLAVTTFTFLATLGISKHTLSSVPKFFGWLISHYIVFMALYFALSFKRAKKAGQLLANFLMHSNYCDVVNHASNVILLGHSLGGKIAVECLNELYLNGYYGKKSLVSKAILFGTAEYNHLHRAKIWKNASKSTTHKSVNVYNTRDKILKHGLGKAAKLMLIGWFKHSKNIAGVSKVLGFNNFNATREMSLPVKKRCSRYPEGSQGVCKIGNTQGHNYTAITAWLLRQPMIRKNGVDLK